MIASVKRKKRRRLPVSLTDAEILEAEIDDLAAAMAMCYADLPPRARASALRLGHSLSQLKQRVACLDWTEELRIRL